MKKLYVLFLILCIPIILIGCVKKEAATVSLSPDVYSSFLAQPYNTAVDEYVQSIKVVTDACIGITGQNYIVRVTDAGYDISGVKAYGRTIRVFGKPVLVIIDPLADKLAYPYILSHEGRHLFQLWYNLFDLNAETGKPWGERSYEIDADHYGAVCAAQYYELLYAGAIPTPPPYPTK